jgi:hypothetical protein
VAQDFTFWRLPGPPLPRSNNTIHVPIRPTDYPPVHPPSADTLITATTDPSSSENLRPAKCSRSLLPMNSVPSIYPTPYRTPNSTPPPPPTLLSFCQQHQRLLRLNLPTPVSPPLHRYFPPPSSATKPQTTMREHTPKPAPTIMDLRR